MDRRKYLLEMIESIVGDKPTAEMLLERLQDEGFIHVGYGNAEVDMVVETFARLYGNTKTTKYDRFAATRLIAKYGVSTVAGVMKLLQTLQDDKYAPSVSNVVEFEEKWPKILNFVRKKGQQGEIIQL